MAHRKVENTVELTLVLVDATALAICVENEHEKQVWIPKAWLDDFREHEDGTCSFGITEERATEKELV